MIIRVILLMVIGGYYISGYWWCEVTILENTYANGEGNMQVIF